MHRLLTLLLAGLTTVTLGGCSAMTGEGGPSTPDKAEVAASAKAARAQAREGARKEAAHAAVARRTTQDASATAISACSEGVLVRAPNGAPLRHCTASIEQLGRDYEAEDLTEQEARATLARIDWMHPEVASKGSDGKEAFGMVSGDFGLVFAYTESPPLLIGEHHREPTCEGWQAASEDGQAAYLARAGWPYRYLSQGLQAMDEVCSNVEARGLTPALGYLLCLSAPTEAGYSDHLSKEQRVAVVRGLRCGENARPLHNEAREPSASERQEARTQEADHREEEAKEKREEPQVHKEMEEGEKQAEQENYCHEDNHDCH